MSILDGSHLNRRNLATAPATAQATGRPTVRTATTNAPRKPNADSPQVTANSETIRQRILSEVARSAPGARTIFLFPGQRRQVADPSEFRDQLFRHVVGKVFLFRVAGEVF